MALATEEQIEALKSYMRKMNTALVADGGGMEVPVADFDRGILHIKLTGDCQSCGTAKLSSDAVVKLINRHSPWLTDVQVLDTALELGQVEQQHAKHSPIAGDSDLQLPALGQSLPPAAPPLPPGGFAPATPF